MSMANANVLERQVAAQFPEQIADGLSQDPDSASRCFAIPQSFNARPQAWFTRWVTIYGARSLDIGDAQQLALARLLPILLCGEQSAVAVFHAEVQRLSGRARERSFHLFTSIESDEYLHDLGLSLLQSKLPKPDDLTRRRRRAQHFFAALGRSPDIASHFARIAHLDSAVAIIMRSLETSLLATEAQAAILFRQIKQDEARHVFISRQHAWRLGFDSDAYRQDGALVRERLIKLLEPAWADFETLGVDSDRLKARLSGATARR